MINSRYRAAINHQNNPRAKSQHHLPLKPSEPSKFASHPQKMCKWGATHYACGIHCRNGYREGYWKTFFNICQPCGLAIMRADVEGDQHLPDCGAFSKKDPRRRWLCNPTKENRDPGMDCELGQLCRLCCGNPDPDTDEEERAEKLVDDGSGGGSGQMN